ncbi:MAG: amino acid ABC transporter permease [Methylobacterium sp.]
MSVQLDFWPVLVQWPLLVRGAALTLALTAVATMLGSLIALSCAWVRVYGPRVLRWCVGAYVELIRNTPFIVQLFFIFFGLPQFGIRLDPLFASMIAMTLNLGAYAAEILRAGIQATPRGQIEAAQSLAITPAQIFFHVVVPPALRKIWPAYTSQIVIVMLGSAVCGQISAEELNYAANLIQSRNFRAFEAYIVATVIFLALAVALRQVLAWIGPRFLFSR